jgi:hypothetical protein
VVKLGPGVEAFRVGEEVTAHVAHIVRDTIDVDRVRGEGRRAMHRAMVPRRQKRCNATPIHIHTWPAHLAGQ